MLTVYCIYWVDGATIYTHDHVRRLRDQVAKHLSFEHKFVCITAEEIDGIECMPPTVDYPGWWQKIGLFSDKMPDGPKLYLDLDVAIVGSLDSFARWADYIHPPEKTLYAPANWAQSGHGGIQSSVMAWCGNRPEICELFNPESARWPPVNEPGKLWGDQEFLTLLRDTGKLEWGEMSPVAVKSYKYHVRGQAGPPPHCRVVVFHGKPKPWEVNEPWQN